MLLTVPRPRMHATDGILDAARDLVLVAGVGDASVSAISSASGAPIGSLYHRFGSQKGLLGQLWIRAVGRSQERFLAALEHPDPREAAVDAALAILAFCASEPADARMLVSFRREDLCRGAATAEFVRELGELNRPVERGMKDLAGRLFGRPTPAAVQRTALATFDLPYGAVRRHLVEGHRFPPALEQHVEAAVRTIIGNGTRSEST